MKVSSEVVQREVAGEHLLIPLGETALKVHGMMTLTESGMVLFERLQEDCTTEDLVQAILSEYEIDEKTARQDVAEFLAKLDAIGILEQ